MPLRQTGWWKAIRFLVFRADAGLASTVNRHHTAEYLPEHANKTAHSLRHWLPKNGARSAFAETVSATITG